MRILSVFIALLTFTTLASAATLNCDVINRTVGPHPVDTVVGEFKQSLVINPKSTVRLGHYTVSYESNNNLLTFVQLKDLSTGNASQWGTYEPGSQKAFNLALLQSGGFLHLACLINN